MGSRPRDRGGRDRSAVRRPRPPFDGPVARGLRAVVGTVALPRPALRPRDAPPDADARPRPRGPSPCPCGRRLRPDRIAGVRMRPLAVAVLLLGPALPGVTTRPDDPPWRREIGKSCLDCHGAERPKGNLNLESILKDEPVRHAAAWEKVARRLRTRQMPPAGKARPTEEAYVAMVSGLESALDAAPPDPGTTDTLRRLTRLQYQNAVRDLLALDIDAAALLPADESSHGFDSATAGTLSPTLLERSLSAAQKISRLAVGGVGRTPGGDTFRVPPDVTQEERVEGLPPGTRGGLRIPYTFPQDGEYDVRIRLMRDRDELVEALLDVLEADLGHHSSGK
ncbi:MAG: DUF1587 domain-containing protein, partial [Planctomycetota bacterium]